MALRGTALAPGYYPALFDKILDSGSGINEQNPPVVGFEIDLETAEEYRMPGGGGSEAGRHCMTIVTRSVLRNNLSGIRNVNPCDTKE